MIYRSFTTGIAEPSRARSIPGRSQKALVLKDQMTLERVYGPYTILELE